MSAEKNIYIVECPNLAGVAVGVYDGDDPIRFDEKGVAEIPQKYIAPYLNNVRFKVTKKEKKETSAAPSAPPAASTKPEIPPAIPIIPAASKPKNGGAKKKDTDIDEL